MFIAQKHQQFLTMDDETVFGTQIATLSWRDLVDKGLLPTYCKVPMTLRADDDDLAHCVGESIARVWEERKRDFNHLIVFMPRTEHALRLTNYLREHAQDTTTIHVRADCDILDIIEQFTRASRAILVNCQVLLEGVDIPRADSIMIAGDKKSYERMTQMILRAGRWYPNKRVFYIFAPTSAHSQHNVPIIDEILERITQDGIVGREPIPIIAPNHEHARDNDPTCIDDDHHIGSAYLYSSCVSYGVLAQFDVQVLGARELLISMSRKIDRDGSEPVARGMWLHINARACACIVMRLVSYCALLFVFASMVDTGAGSTIARDAWVYINARASLIKQWTVVLITDACARLYGARNAFLAR
jgi:hypothetical protein